MSIARGEFDVDVTPLPEAPEGLTRFRLEKRLTGDLSATSRGEMISAGNPVKGAAGYVALEQVTGTLHGKAGTFALQHGGTMDAGGAKMHVVVTPGSGTGALEGLAGTFFITQDDDGHRYTFDYTLP